MDSYGLHGRAEDPGGISGRSLSSRLAGKATRMRLTAVQYVMQTKLPTERSTRTTLMLQRRRHRLSRREGISTPWYLQLVAACDDPVLLISFIHHTMAAL